MVSISTHSIPIGPATTLAQPMVLIPAPPIGLKRLAVGGLFHAFVLQGTTKGLAEIDTSFGKLQLTTNFPLRPQTNLQLQIIGKFPLMQLLITSVQGHPPQSALRTLTTNNSTKASGLAQGTASSILSNPVQSVNSESISLTLGAKVVATKTKINLTPTPLQNSTCITATPPSRSNVTPAPNNPGFQTAAETNKSSSIKATSKNHSIDTILNQTSSRFSVKITNILPPSQLSNGGGVPSTGKKSLTVGQSVVGVVTMTNPQGHAIVQTHAGPISLATPNFLSPGTTISFLITATLNPLSIEPLGQMTDRNAEIIMETHRWLELDEAVRVLNEGHPTLGQQVVNSILPKAGTSLAANIILLVSAIRNGDIKNWFGDAPVRALQRIKPELMSRLRDDFLNMSHLSDDNTSSVWRSYPIPFVNGQEIEQIRLYVKRKAESDDDDFEPPDQGSRFILDLDLTNMGRLQLDGLVRTSQKQFDLILRTDNPLHQMLQNGIRGIFQKAIEQTGHMGGLTFQAAPAIFTDIQSDRTRPPDEGFIA